MKLKLLILSLLLCTFFANAQTNKKPWAVGANIGAFDYYTPLNQKLFNTDKWKFNPSVTLSRYLSPSFDLTGRLTYGNTILHPELLSRKGYKNIIRGIHDGDLLLRYKFNNGYIFNENARFFPYLTAGLGLNRVAKNTHTVLPVGLGFGLRLSDRFTALIESNYKFPLFDMNPVIGRSEHMYNSIGLSYAFGNKEPKIMDKDKDGVVDNLDNCPTVFGSKALKGCPDMDGDGIADWEDRCPKLAGVVTLMGCPDKDGDGVPDYLDQCPDVAGLRDNLGCPRIVEPIKVDTIIPVIPVKSNEPNVDEIPDNLIKRIYYLVYQHELTPAHYMLLDTVVSMLNTYPTLKIQIGGHTDISGGDAINFPLSVQRAEKVKEYFLTKGIAFNRVFALGYGSKYPIVPNTTPENRATNRRTEIRFQKH